jgi:hypothetical protein
MITKGMKTIIVNCQLKRRPKIRPKHDNAKDSHMTPNLVPVICWIANASEERRVQIAPELFSGWSK